MANVSCNVNDRGRRKNEGEAVLGMDSMTGCMGCARFSMYPSTFFFDCDKQSVTSPQTELMEVGPRHHEFQTVPLVDHLDLQNTTHRTRFDADAYKGYGLNS